VKDFSLPKAINAKHMSKFAALSPVMVTADGELKIAQAAINKKTHLFRCFGTVSVLEVTWRCFPALENRRVAFFYLSRPRAKNEAQTKIMRDFPFEYDAELVAHRNQWRKSVA
jgi:hypothetical protein